MACLINRELTLWRPYIWSFSSNWIREEKFSHIYSNHVLFCLTYRHNGLLLIRKVDFINEWKWKDRYSEEKIVKCRDGALKMKTYVESPQKQSMGPVFNIQNSQLLNWSLSIGKIFQEHGQNWPVANLLVVILILLLSRQKCHYQSHSIRNIRVFFSFFSFLPLQGKFERHCLLVIPIFHCFSSHNPFILEFIW